MRFPIAPLRRISESFMPTPCVLIETSPGEDDPYGGTGSPTEARTETRCRVEPGTGRENVLNEVLRSQVSARVYLPYGTEATAQTTLEIEGRRFNVLYVSVQSPEYAADVEAFVEDVG